MIFINLFFHNSLAKTIIIERIAENNTEKSKARMFSSYMVSAHTFLLLSLFLLSSHFIVLNI